MIATLIVGCGYLGRRVARRLVERGERVAALTRSGAKAAELAALGIEPVIGDVLDRASLAGRLPDAERVVYAVAPDAASGVPMRAVAVEGLNNTLRGLGERTGRIVYASSTGVYGGADGGWVDEETPPDPRTASGLACLGGEGELVRHTEGSGVLAFILRFAGLYGPGRIIGRAVLEKGSPIVGDPGKYLNLIHVDDAASAVLAALDRPGGGGTYVIADDRPAERREYYGRVAELCGYPAPRFTPSTTGDPRARREESNKRASNRKLREELGVALAYPDITTGLPAALAAEAG